ncbi:MAG: DNA-binding protein [Lysobacterales bacterium]|nr:MAG: DNA-binding protein [Xanthomonadales bacterium]
MLGEGDVDTELLSEQKQIERKLFTFDLRENMRGRFLRITEDVGGRRDAIVVPSTGLEQLRQILDRAIYASEAAGPGESAQVE